MDRDRDTDVDVDTGRDTDVDMDTDVDTDVDMDSYPAKMVPTSAMNHSAELKPRIPTPWQRCNPSCRETGVC